MSELSIDRRFSISFSVRFCGIEEEVDVSFSVFLFREDGMEGGGGVIDGLEPLDIALLGGGCLNGRSIEGVRLSKSNDQGG